MANVTVEGTAEEMGSVIGSLAEHDKRERERVEKESQRAQKEYEAEQEAAAEEAAEEMEEGTMAEVNVADLIAKGFADLGDRIASKLDELKPQPSAEEKKAARREELLTLRDELAALDDDGDTDGTETTPTPKVPVKKTTAKKTTAPPPTEEGETPTRRRGWF